MKKYGFTLIEVLTVMFIIGILVTITSYVFAKSLERNRDTQRLSDLNNIKNSLEQFYLVNKTYPYNTAYKASLIPRPWVAKYELERYKIATCDSGLADPGKNYLAPTYMTTLPEDPLYTVARSLNANCQLEAMAGQPVAGYGQYLYTSLATNEATSNKVGQYYLMARLERQLNISDSFPTIDPRYALTISRINSWGQTYCSNDSGNPLDSGCSYNYYLKNSNND
ncbi:MAG: prepilin-type N-terminal cleavage/methylation domain-containing protein [Patescibacteria group bacterium]